MRRPDSLTSLVLVTTLGFSMACLGIGKKNSDDADEAGGLVEATNPSMAIDRDGDGLTDSEEQMLGTDPDSVDTDGDSWQDGIEVDNYTDPLKKNDHPYEGGYKIGACRHDIDPTGDGVGQITANFSLPDQYGDNVKLHDFCDDTVLLVSSAFW